MAYSNYDVTKPLEPYNLSDNERKTLTPTELLVQTVVELTMGVNEPMGEFLKLAAEAEKVLYQCQLESDVTYALWSAAKDVIQDCRSYRDNLTLFTHHAKKGDPNGG